MLLRHNTAAEVTIETTATADSYRIIKQGSIFAVAGAGTITLTGVSNVYKIALAAGDTDTLGDLWIGVFDSAFPATLLGSSDNLVCVDVPGGDVTQVLGDVFGNVRGNVNGFVVNPSTVYLAGIQPNYAPAKPGDLMGLVGGEENNIASALLNFVDGADVGITPRHALMILVAVLAGKLSTVGNVAKFRNAPDTKDRVTVTTGAGGQRVTVVFDFT